jgi:hypothetical protein
VCYKALKIHFTLIYFLAVGEAFPFFSPKKLQYFYPTEFCVFYVPGFGGKTGERNGVLFNNLTKICKDISVFICDVTQNTFYILTDFGNSFDMMTEHSNISLKFELMCYAYRNFVNRA